MKRSLTSMDNSASSQKEKRKNPVIPSNPNQIFKLNNDCLAEIFSYLPIRDVSKVLQTNDRFRTAALIRFGCAELDQMDNDCLMDLPFGIREDFYKAYGPRVTRMKFKLLSSGDFLDAIRHFQNLNELILSEVILPDNLFDTNELPKSLRSLEIDRCSIPDQFLQKWFVAINATLTELRIVHRRERKLKTEPTTYCCLEVLTNLSKLNIDGVLPEAALVKLIEQNKNQLRSLVMVKDGSIGPLASSIWESISKLQQLTEFQLANYIVNAIEPRPFNLWPELTSLTLQIADPYPIIAQLGCQLSLNTLSFIHIPLYFHVLELRPLTRFQTLRTLELSSFQWQDTDNLDEVGVLQQIHCLVLNGGIFSRSSEVLDLVANMPNLRKLLLEQVTFLVDEEMDVGKLEMQVKKALEQRQPPLEFQVSICGGDDFF